MWDLTNGLGVQSWCFRHFKTREALIEQIRAIGVSRVELCGVHADFEDEGAFESIIGAYRDAGIQITSIGVQSFRGEEVREEKWFRFCQMAGAKMIAATFEIPGVPQAFGVAERLAEKYGVLVGIHNHGGYHWLGNGDMLRHTFNITSERIGLCLDSAWCLQSGEDPLRWAEEFQPRLYGVHIKDFTFLPTGKPEDVVVGTGNLRLREFLQLVQRAPRMEAVTLEYEGDVENPAPKLRECVAAIRGAT